MNRKLEALFVSVGIVCMIVGLVALAQSSTPSGGPYYLQVPTSTWTYQIGVFSNGSYYMVNGSNWNVDYQSTNFTKVRIFAIGNCTTGGRIFYKSGTYQQGNQVNITTSGIIEQGESQETVIFNDTTSDMINTGLGIGGTTDEIEGYEMHNIQLRGYPSTSAGGEGIHIYGNAQHCWFGQLIISFFDTAINMTNWEWCSFREIKMWNINEVGIHLQTTKGQEGHTYFERIDYCPTPLVTTTTAGVKIECSGGYGIIETVFMNCHWTAAGGAGRNDIGVWFAGSSASMAGGGFYDCLWEALTGCVWIQNDIANVKFMDNEYMGLDATLYYFNNSNPGYSRIIIDGGHLQASSAFINNSGRFLYNPSSAWFFGTVAGAGDLLNSGTYGGNVFCNNPEKIHYSYDCFDWGYYVRKGSTNSSTTDGGYQAHGLCQTPSFVLLTSGNSSESVTCAAYSLGATYFKYHLTDDNGTAVTGQTVYWYAVYGSFPT